MKYIDIHAHTNFKAFDEDRSEVLARAREAGVIVINVGTQIDTSRKAVEMAEDNENVYAIVGLHPIHTGKSFHDEKELGEGGKEFTSRGENFDKELYREWLKNPKVVGIGECGLDYYHMDPESIEKQKKDFISQIELANESGKALMMHIRNPSTSSGQVPDSNMPSAYMDALSLLKEYYKPVDGIVRADSHFFAGSIEEAQALLDYGCTMSFTGAITYPRKKDANGNFVGCDYEAIIKMTPLDRIMTETDCPYVAPVPFRGKRNEPMYIPEIVKKIAEIKGMPEEEVASAILVNAKRIFRV